MLILDGGGYSGYWYVLGALQAGAAQQQERIVGWSSSAVAAATWLCELPFERALRVSERHRHWTLDLRAVVGAFLDELLPADAAERCGQLTVMQADGLGMPRFFRATSRAELIEAIAVSCDLLRLSDGYFAFQSMDPCRREGHTVLTSPIPSALAPPTAATAHRFYELGLAWPADQKYSALPAAAT